jgi:pyroglutamyl-peptidase
MRVILTGFEPSWGIKKTPSGELAKLWAKEQMPVEAEVKSIVLPQIFGTSTKILCDAIAEFEPQIVFMFGATTKADPIRLERFAINVEHTVMGDNNRIPISDRPILKGGPSAYESTLPIDFLVSHLNNRNISAKTSYHAGTHTCNALLYGCMHYLSSKPDLNIVAGFIHVPFPNEFGVVGDEPWAVAGWTGIIQASVVLMQETINWYNHVFGAR